MAGPARPAAGGALTATRTGHAAGLAGAALLLTAAAAALLAPVLAPYDPGLPATTPFAAPSLAHPLGANDAGYDLLSEVIHGARPSLLVAALAAAIATVVGTTVGLVAGFLRGRVDAVLMRGVDVLLALPLLPLTIVLSAYAGPGVVTEIAVIGGLLWARTAREIRSQVLSLRERGSVDAARAMGARTGYVLTRHLAPAVGPLVVPQLVRSANVAILMDASLGFLGLGDAAARSWGTTLYYAHARSAFLTDAWLWWVLPPGLCIAAVVLGFALVGYALEERARPRLRTVGGGPPIRPPAATPGVLDPAAAAIDAPLVLRDLTVEYAAAGGPMRAVDAASFTIRRGEVLGLVGESGSGKTTLVLAVLGLLRPPARVTAGRVLLAGEDLAAASEARLARLRGRTVALIPQGAMNALNPVLSIGHQVAEAIAAHRRLPRHELRARVSDLLTVVGIPPERRVAYPHELSGGMRQRVVIAMALANDPALLVADELTNGLDPIAQAGLLSLLAELRTRLGLAVLFVSHELPVVLGIADRLAVMHGGRIVEQGDARAVAAQPSHACTRRLLDAVPRLHPVSPSTRTADPRPPGVPVLEIAGVRKVVRRRGRRAVDRVILDGVSLTVGASEAVGLVGVSGAGKTTLARLVAGLGRPDAGRILIDGDDAWGGGTATERERRRRFHLVFQDPYDALPPAMRVQEIVAEPLAIHAIGSRAQRLERVRDALADVSLAPVDRYLPRYAQELSGGERQRVALARAIVLRPRLIVADEPTTMLDMSLRLDLLALLTRLRRRHAIGCLYITHDLSLARAFCDRLVILHDGQVVEEGATADLIDAPVHPHTRRLVGAALSLGGGLTGSLEPDHISAYRPNNSPAV